MADISKTVAIIFQGQDQGASAAADKLAASMAKAEAATRGASNSGDLWQDAAGRWRNSVGQFATDAEKAAAGVESVGEKSKRSAQNVDTLRQAFQLLATSIVIKAFADANSQVEIFERSMTLLKGSTQAANAEFSYISKLADDLGLELKGAADAYVSLTAATKGTALEGQATRDIFEAVSKAMSSLGKSSADTQGALLAISQIVSKGTVSLEELRGQLGERLPGAFQIAARAMGVTTQELDKLVSGGNLTAEEFLPKLAAALNDTFGETSRVETFSAAFNRMQNAVSSALVDIGSTGAFAALTKGVEVVSATVVGAAAGFRLLGEAIGIIAGAIATGNFSSVSESLANSWERFGDTTRNTATAMLGLRDASGEAAVAVSKAGSDVNLFAGDVRKYEDAQKLAAEATDKAKKSSEDAVKALAAETKERQRAEEAAQKYALELEKLASNERIKTLEFRAEIDVARIQADAEKVIAAFESINNTVNSTGDVIGDLFGLFDQLGNLDSSARNALFAQLDIENKRRQEALDMQKELTQAQIAQIKAQTRQLERGDALIQIDGAGLQPHLEAFMWEILKAIQVRVNSDGGRLLLGL